jgi:hypothetical protein
MKPPATRISVRTIDLFERPVVLRLPFRFGSVTVRETPQAFVRAEIRLEGGGTSVGAAAELQVPKWFDKRPELSNADNIAQLDTALAIARDAYLSDAGPATVFDYHVRHAAAVRAAALARGLPPLVASFGLALIDRALIDALGRALGLSFADAMRANAFGFAAAAIAPDLVGFDAAAFLARLSPRTSIAARHTVGLLDPLNADDLHAGAPADGLPVTLEQVIAAYRHDHFKLKVSGRIADDIARLERIASILDTHVGQYAATLDGNEQFPDASAVAELMARMSEAPALAGLLRSLLLIEQPIARTEALKAPLGELGGRFPFIIDESDAEDGSLNEALALGYRGVSSKACKGVWRSLVNAARLAQRPGGGILSGEDLTTQAGLAVQQDLAIVSLLGLTHVERNGHHYVDGFAATPLAEAGRFRCAHPDLYHESTGRVRLLIRGGRITLTTVNAAAGLGSAVVPDFTAMRPKSR